ncbi:MAG: carbamoyltransferase [Thiothrix sp.]|nr:MAG: carbamoyltransferase [Thiothrix sp.]
MIILGLNYAFHDSTACLVRDGELIAAIEEERLSRDKHTTDFPRLCVDKCLEVAGMDYGDIDHIAVSIKPTHMWKEKLFYGLRNMRNIRSFAKRELSLSRGRQQQLNYFLSAHWPQKHSRPAVHYIEHHLSHAAGSFYVSPYEEAALLGIDGSGEWATTWLGAGRGNSIECFGESLFPHSLGSFYEAVTEFCGFRPNYDEGKTMGLAPLGDPEHFYEVVSKIISVDEEGQVTIDLSFFSYQHHGRQRCAPKFYKIFGLPREPDAPFEQRHLDMAAAAQRVLEDRALELCEVLYEKTQADYLVVAGGVSLNSVMNGRIVRESKFKDVYVMPAAGDNGTAIGAAYYLYNGLLGKERNFIHSNPYVGTEYSNSEIIQLLKKYKLQHEVHENISSAAADLLQEGNIIGWFQGRMEIGPRALGNRSILANPAILDMKDKINAEVKHREAYRPFAPSTTVEAKDEFFNLTVEAPFMLKVCDVLPEQRGRIPAVTHVDGSARLQTVRRETNAPYYDLITALGERTGVPVVLNTSFNIQGEPIVESPRDAIRCFFSTGLDVLVIGNCVVRK